MAIFFNFFPNQPVKLSSGIVGHTLIFVLLFFTPYYAIAQDGDGPISQEVVKIQSLVGEIKLDGKLSELHPEFEINGEPLVETGYDSDYWVWIHNLQFTVPLYSFLGYFTSGNFTSYSNCYCSFYFFDK